MRGHIRSRGPDTHQLIWYTGRGPDGKPKYASCTVHGTRREAEAKLATILASIHTGDYVEPSRETVGQYLLRWLEEIKPTVRPSTWQWYHQHCEWHLIPTLGPVRLDKLSPLQIQDAYRRLLEDGRVGDSWGGKAGDPLDPGTVHGAHRTLRCALNQAVKWGILVKNPALNVTPPKPNRMEYQILTPEQAVALLGEASARGRRSLYLAAVTTGLRLGELLGLRWTDVDLERGTLTVRQTLRKGGLSPEYSTPKTKAGYRTVTMPESLVAALKEDQATERKLRKLYGPRWRDNGLVWHTAEGNPLMPRNVTKQFQTMLVKLKLPRMRFHDLRHTMATWLFVAGKHPKAVQERLGHSNIAVTMDLYTHSAPGLQQQIAADIDKMISDARNAREGGQPEPAS